jgi:hypothetical protein
LAKLGSDALMFPEQARDEPVTARTNVFHLGLLVYQLLDGQPCRI